ncbi:MAG: hypothetical protein ACLSGH_04025 [Faecalibacillus intestinalis]|uniref:hypothetical protein n=1 Tax=Faecalibacillus intestinalis TaxID=1982626 RepID=UPI0005098087|nr:hypothetical protein [Faecalibacillus intestinalis]MED9808510.1 hypothetical protein [Faecalibacillus intestinalis]OKZ98681.1 MAG: hypothetical protein BHW13_02850 [Coprobacillus sp. CAG:235_29_27]HJI22320.1 hypothetical protein [Coprobacillaceae bacterium]
MHIGCGKVLWKILVALKRRNIHFLNKQLCVLSPFYWFNTGRKSIHFACLLPQIMTFPICLFFGTTVIGMILFTFKSKSN